MKKIVITVVALLFAIPAFCALNPYLSIKGGYEYGFQKYKANEWISSSKMYDADNAVFGLAAGHWFTDKLRAEIAYNYKFDNSLRKGLDARDMYGLPINLRESLKQHTVLINAYYHPFSDWIVSPYLGAGAGWGWSKYKVTDLALLNISQNNFAYAFYLGADYKLTERLALDLSFTYNSILSDHSRLKDIYSYGGALALRYKI